MPVVPFAPTQEIQGGGFEPASSGGGVEPMRNYSGQQAQQAGDAMLSAGQVLGRIAHKMQGEMDDASIKKAETAFLGTSQEILRGENGYFNQIGAGATDTVPTTTAIQKAKEEARKTLTNDVQRQQFDQSADLHIVNFNGQIAEHRITQTRTYAAGESKARSDQYVLEAANNYSSIGAVDAKGNPTGAYNTALQTALHEADHASDLSMFPADSEQRKAARRDVYNGVSTGVVTNLMAAGRYIEAKAYVDGVVKSGNVDAATAKSLTAAVDSNYDTQVGLDAADKTYDGKPVGGKTSPENIKTGVTKAVPGATVVKVGGETIPLRVGSQPGRQPLEMNGVHQPLLDSWEKVQGDFGRSVTIVSGYRNPVTNARAGGARHSQHMSGNAIDVDVANMSIEDRKKLISLARARGFTGIGVYDNSLHFDMRKSGPAMWGPSHHADSIPAWASGVRDAPVKVASIDTGTSTDAGTGVPATGTRDYHVPDTGAGDLQTIFVQPIKGMQIGDFAKQLRSQGFQVTNIMEAQPENTGDEPTWSMAVKLPDQMIGTPEGSTTVPTNADGTRDLAAMEKGIKDLNLETDQEKVAIAQVRQRYAVDKQAAAQRYTDTLDWATQVASKPGGSGWKDIVKNKPEVWASIKADDQAKLKNMDSGTDEDVKLALIMDPSETVPGKIEQYRKDLSVNDYQAFVKSGMEPDKVIAATIDADMFKSTLIRNGMTSMIEPKSDAEKQSVIIFHDKYKVLIDAEQRRLKKELSMTEKQAILDGIFLDKAYVDGAGSSPAQGTTTNFWGTDKQEPVYFLTPDEEKKAYVMVGNEQVLLASIPADDQAIIEDELRKQNRKVTMQAVAERWVKDLRDK